MSKILNLTVVLCICMGSWQCTKISSSSPNKPPRELSRAEKSLVESDNNFGLKLFQEIVKKERDKNVFISPLSVSMALGMTYNGANGSTQEAMQKTLQLSGLAIQEVNESYKSLIELLTGLDPKVKFQIANSIWYRQNWVLERDFLNLCNTYFKAVIRGLDFNDPNASNIINGWVNENTNGKIKGIVDAPIDPLTVMFLINAIYFKGTWSYEFDINLTQDDWFTLPDGSQKPCKMMLQKGDFQYFETPDFQAVDLSYGEGGFSMTIFLPRLQKRIDDLVAEINQENWNQWINSFSKHKGTLQLPKFTLEYGLTLNNVLRALGMAIAFDPSQADFTKMYKGPDSLFISMVKHKTFVEVNEEGTEAAADTSVEIRTTSVAPTGFSMKVDRPFVFAIRENHSQTILFIGKIIEPTLE